jgi:hypothetical protein
MGDSSGISSERSNTTNNDEGTAFEAIWETKDFTAEDYGVPDIDRMMRWKGIEVWAKGGTLKIYYSTDSGGTWTLATTLTLSPDYPVDSSPLNAYFDVVSTKLRLRFLNSEDDETFTLKKYQISATLREARK